MHSGYVWERRPRGLGMWRSGVTTGAFSLEKKFQKWKSYALGLGTGCHGKRANVNGYCFYA